MTHTSENLKKFIARREKRRITAYTLNRMENLAKLRTPCDEVGCKGHGIYRVGKQHKCSDHVRHHV
jgi:hypothetical protein